ncbi:CinA family protein [Rhodoligotrophos defluvii]|uniref:CinA family protein n=1 Tax=Rhodoligotrophos defluvii TaxID=2561934 RepID=UPI0010C99AE9|nr:CinA family protein [Rhodoligotrophos defluvii]
MFDDEVIREARAVLDLCASRKMKITTAESCTGGLISACLTEIPGSSAFVDRGFVTYSNEAKSELLGVPADMIETHGAVSEQVARAMAEGALERSKADIAVSVTGIAGPDGGSEAKSVGLVHLACAARNGPTLHRRMLFGNQGRHRIRILSVRTAFVLISQQLDESTATV